MQVSIDKATLRRLLELHEGSDPAEVLAAILDEADPVEDDEAPDHGDYDDEDPESPLADGTYFADPHGTSCLRAATAHNPRNLPCPTCRTPNRLTPADRARGYQCDRCADARESGRDYGHVRVSV